MVERPVIRARDEFSSSSDIVLAENVSFEEFQKRFAEQHAEWLVGKVILVVPNNTRHQIILGFLYRLISSFLDFRPLGRLLLAGVPMYISEGQPAREPDLIFVLNEHRSRIKENRLDGAADLVVEIVSPESIERDYEKKLTEYAAAGVREYWLLDPLKPAATFLSLGDDRRFTALPLDSQGRLVSKVLPGFALHPDILWREEHPSGAELIALAQGMVNTL